MGDCDVAGSAGVRGERDTGDSPTTLGLAGGPAMLNSTERDDAIGEDDDGEPSMPPCDLRAATRSGGRGEGEKILQGAARGNKRKARASDAAAAVARATHALRCMRAFHCDDGGCSQLQ